MARYRDLCSLDLTNGEVDIALRMVGREAARESVRPDVVTGGV
jgi:hypothetical protein